jgi:hypothetical protein
VNILILSLEKRIDSEKDISCGPFAVSRNRSRCNTALEKKRPRLNSTSSEIKRSLPYINHIDLGECYIKSKKCKNGTSCKESGKKEVGHRRNISLPLSGSKTQVNLKNLLKRMCRTPAYSPSNKQMGKKHKRNKIINSFLKTLPTSPTSPQLSKLDIKLDS